MIDQDLLKEANTRFSYLDDIESAMIFPPEFVQVRHTHIKPLALYYLDLRPGVTEPEEGTGILSIIQLLWRYFEVNDLLTDHLNLQQETLAKGDSDFHRSVLEARIAAIIKPCSKIKSLLVNYVSLLNWDTPIYRIFDEAQAGDDEALFKLVQVDKSVLALPRFQTMLVDKQLCGDWEFFQVLGKAVSARPLNARVHLPKAVAIVAYFWESHFKEMKFTETVDVLREHKILPNANDYNYFRKQLHRFGLKKSRYNKK